MRLITALVIACMAAAQTPTAYLRSGGPAGYVINGASNTTPMVIQTDSAHGLSVGDIVVNWGVNATVSGNCVASAANGLRKVKAVVDTTHFSITDLNGVDVASNGVWCDGSTPAGYPGGAAAGGKLTSYSLSTQPRGLLDGLTGTWTRKLALGTNNGLISLIVSGNVATATTGYSHGLTTNDKIGVWGSGVSALNNSGNPYSVTVTSSTTFTFTTVGVANGVYSNANNTCGPLANQDCLRISQLAYTGEIWWDAIVNRFTSFWESGTTYQHAFDGGTIGLSGSNFNLPRYWANAAVKFLVDPSDTQMLNVAKYCVNHMERANGVSWTANEQVAEGGNVDFTDYASFTPQGLAMCYVAARDYLTPTEKQTFANKVYNDLEDSSNLCNKTRNLPIQEVLSSGIAQAGSSNTITLASSDTAADNFYVNNVVMIQANGTVYAGVVTSYISATKVATISGTWGFAPTTGTPYTIYASIIISSTASGATATVTGYNTHFTTDVHVGDAVIGGDVWVGGSYGVEPTESYVTTVTSDTSLTVINGNLIQTSTTTPTILWIARQWQAGDCGLLWQQSHWSGGLVSPSVYPPSGGSSSATPGLWDSPQAPGIAGNNGFSLTMGWTNLDLAMADDDTRAVAHLAKVNELWWDWQIRGSWNYATGLEHAGSNYSVVRVERDGVLNLAALYRSVPLFSWPDFSTWASSKAIYKTYGTYPDRRYSAGTGASVPWGIRWGASVGSTPLDGTSETLTAWLMNPNFIFNPSSIQSQYYMSWIKSFCCTYDGWNRIQQELDWVGFLTVDPRIQSSDYTAQPTQHLFQSTSIGACQATGWPCPSTFRADGVVSRSGWSSRSDTLAYFGVRTYWNDHDVPEGGTLRVYKVGHLLAPDDQPPGSATELGGSPDQTIAQILDTMPQFAGATANVHRGENFDGVAATATITRWASANHGSWDTAYGDANSRYAYAMADLSGIYTTAYNRVWRNWAQFKKSGTEEILIQFDDFDVSNAPTQVETHIHYAQNGETQDGYPEGQTTCPGLGGCASLDSTRIIQSLEDGGTDAFGDPARTYGILSRYYSNGTIFVRDDGSSYSGGQGHTHRVSLCGGASCGSTVNTYTALTIHKIASSLSDTTLTSKLLTTSPSWIAAQVTSADNTTGKVAVFSIGGVSESVSFTSDHPGTAQYLVAGVTAPQASVLLNGVPISGSPFTVTDGDNTIYWEGTAGAYTISAGPLLVASPSSLSLSCYTGAVGSPVALSISALGTTLLSWNTSVSQPWITVSPATGTAAGTTSVSANCSSITIPGTYTGNITVSGVGALALTNSPITVPVTLTVSGSLLTLTPSSLSLPCTIGGTHPSGSIAVGSIGVSPIAWTASSDQTWLGITPTSGTAAGSITATETCDSLTVGVNTAHITVNSTTTGITNSPQQATITSQVYAAVSITTTSIPSAFVGFPYSFQLQASGGQTPYTWSLLTGSLPAGITLNSSGLISGTTSATTVSNFTVRAVDVGGGSATQPLTLSVLPPPGGSIIGNPTTASNPNK